jgi:hypothetical protein
MDHPLLDHRLERTPRLSHKLLRQLLEQRHQKLYGKETRYWAYNKLELSGKSLQDVYLLASVPAQLNDLIAAWALRSGVYLEGIFSLAAAISTIGPSGTTTAQRIRAVQFASVTYIIVQDSHAHPLYFIRAGACGDDHSRVERSAERLALFVEQEFGLELTSEERVLAETEELTADCLLKPASKTMLNICAPHERRRQTSLRIRLRVFAALVCALLITAFLIQPRLAEKHRLDSESLAYVPEIRVAELKLEAVEAALAEAQILRQVVAFCRNRTVDKIDDPVASPILVLFSAVIDVLSPDLELDRLECQVDESEDTLLVQLRGRPLTPDLDLSAQLKPFREGLENQGWIVEEVSINFVRSEGSSQSRFSRRGTERFFEARVVVRAEPLNLSDL